MLYFVCFHTLISDFTIAFLHKSSMEAGDIVFRWRNLSLPFITVIMFRSAFKLYIFLIYTYLVIYSCESWRIIYILLVSLAFLWRLVQCRIGFVLIYFEHKQKWTDPFEKLFWFIVLAFDLVKNFSLKSIFNISLFAF